MLAAVVGAASAAVPTPAAAQAVVGLDGQAVLPLGSFARGVVAGGGVRGRVGYQYGLSWVDLSGEATGGYGFLPNELEDGLSFDVAQFMLGGRATFGSFLAPSLFVDVGVGTVAGRARDHSFERRGLALLAGTAFDYRRLPVVDFGLHAAYGRVVRHEGRDAGPESRADWDWLELGAHVSAACF